MSCKLVLHLIKHKQAIILTNFGTKGSEEYWVRNLRGLRLIFSLNCWDNLQICSFNFRFSKGNYIITFPAPTQDCHPIKSLLHVRWVNRIIAMWCSELFCGKTQDGTYFLDTALSSSLVHKEQAKCASSLYFVESHSPSHSVHHWTFRVLNSFPAAKCKYTPCLAHVFIQKIISLPFTCFPSSVGAFTHGKSVDQQNAK